MKLTELPPIPVGANPFNHDLFNMGTRLGKGITVMHRNFPDAPCPYLIIIDSNTGKRVRIDITDPEEDKTLPAQMGRNAGLGFESMLANTQELVK